MNPGADGEIVTNSAAKRTGSGLGIHRVTATVLVLSLIVVGLAAWATRTVVHDQDSRLLNERANEVALVFNANINAIPTSMITLGNLAREGGTALFDRQASQLVKAGPGHLTFALLRPATGGYVVVTAVGSELSVGQLVTGVAASVVATARAAPKMVTTPVLGTGRTRSVGFALAGPAGTVVYRVSALGPLSAPRQAGTAPFHELRVALYASARPHPAQVVVATTKHLPLRGSVRYVPINAGASHWLLAASSTEPLVGSVAAAVPWFVLAVGIIGSILIGLVLEQVIRRRDAAVNMYQSERQLAETLQQKLLPPLPALDGLDVATRYIAASEGQAVGGDWFDVFDLHDGRAAIVIGDVIGHDIEAAAAMSQVRAALRAYAWDGDDPAAVIERLARMVDAFKIAGLVTVVYGVLGHPDGDGARLFRWANAGHLPPLLRMLGGDVLELLDGSSRVIGAPPDGPRTQGEYLLPRGSTLVLYTDGLVELPGIALTESMEQVRRMLERQDPDAPAETVCESILRSQPTTTSRDDIAIVVVRILAQELPAERVPASAHGAPFLPR
jgi:serine phosphatase RsbU (regulator of sigma subunit)